MVEAGIESQIAAEALANIGNDPVFEAALKFQQIRSKLESQMLNLCRLQQLSPKFGVIESRTSQGLSSDDFFEHYYVANRPVILTDFAKGWPAMTRWTPEFLRDHFGHLPVTVQSGRSSDPKFEEHKALYQHTELLGDFARRVLEVRHSNDFYLTANNELLRHPEVQVLYEDVGRLVPYLDPARLRAESSLWFGPGGTITPLHHDATHLFHLQVLGRKRWRFISPLQSPLLYNRNGVFSPIDLDKPDLHRFPLFAQAQVLDVVVHPGEAVFLPLGWWHHVTSLDICISMSFSGMAYPNSFEYINPSIIDWN